MSHRFDIEGWVDDRLGIAARSHSDKGQIELVMECPSCGRTKMYLHSKLGSWCCFKCGASGGIVRLIMLVEGCSFSDAKRMLRGSRERPSLTLSEIRGRQEEADEDEKESGVSLPDEFIPVWDTAASTWRVPAYLPDRGIKARTAAMYRLGYCLEGRYEGRLILPAHMNGKLRTFQGRAMGPQLPKYLGPPDDRKSAVLWGYDEVLGAEELVLVEGPIDVLAMHQHGFAAVGLMGKVAGPAQASLIARAVPARVYVMLDPDAAGLSAMAGIAATIGEVIADVRVARLTSGDPAETSTGEVAEAIRVARPPSIRDRFYRLTP